MRKKDLENKDNKIKFKNMKKRRKRKIKYIFKITEINLQKIKNKN